ncbi:MAG: hypothetical protein F4227_01470 [Gammaproteobacteria bacterium]|nr:hypothetical protein [Gammaproteobacteria bacterium]MYF01673.1 hypothetical protein [Gammaproteobacteria bacterium]MYI76804.1 hypothetical protein [Gammaproteobacteria bacterium]
MFKQSIKSKISVALAAVLLVLVTGVLSGSSNSSSREVDVFWSYNCRGKTISVPYQSSNDYRYYCAIKDGDGNRVKSWMVVVRDDPAIEATSVDNDTRDGQCNNCPATGD